MFYTLKNDYLTVKISDLGAELCSVQAKNGCEYMWQPEAGHWQGHAPWLFPICSRLYEGRYIYRGRSYEMPGHGFARTSYFTGMKVSDTVLLPSAASPLGKSSRDSSLSILCHIACNTWRTETAFYS